MKNKKLLLLTCLTAILLFAYLFVFTNETSPVLRSVVSGFGGFAIILVSVSIGVERIRVFTRKSKIGKSLLYICIGMFLWGLGNMVWLYYNIAAQEDVPYPSLADIGYLGLIPFATVGLFLLLRSIKISFDIKTIIKLVSLPLVVFILMYWLVISSKLFENVELLEKILNITYPIGDFIFLSLTLVILSLIKGGKLFKPVAIICIGFIFQAMADLIFSWTTSNETYFTGCWVDALFTMSFFALGVGMHYTSEIQKATR